MTYLLLTAGLFLAELLYFRIADKLNIIDKPNDRSSHKVITLRGGGIIFPLSLVAYFLGFGHKYPWFMVGLVIIAAISFADDVAEQSKKLRLILHFLAVSLLIYQARLFQEAPLWLIPVAFVVIIGIINAFNFMDGINGITSGYGFTILLGLWLVNRQAEIIDPAYLACLAAGNLVFAFFNFRRKARCFAGDVGSVSMAFSLIYPMVLCMWLQGNVIFILFFALYGVDTVLTILHRLYKGENIFEAHRQHLFQYLANEKGWGHLRVTALYMALQTIITLLTVWIWAEGSLLLQWIFGLITLIMLSVVHWRVKFGIIRALAVSAGKTVEKKAIVETA